MKILKFFIILFGLIILACSNIKAQKLATFVDVEMELSNTSPPPPPEDVPVAYYRTISGEFTVEMYANVTVTLALSIYDSDGNLLERSHSASPTDYNIFTPFSIDADTGDQLYLECGFISANGAYHADSGCTVIVDPFYGVSMVDGN